MKRFLFLILILGILPLYGKTVSNKNISFNGIKFKIPKTWKKASNDSWKNNDISLSVSSENTTMNLKKYVKLNIGNFKKLVKSYKIISKKSSITNGNKYYHYLGKFKLSDMIKDKKEIIAINFIMLSAKNIKYLITIKLAPKYLKKYKNTIKNIIKSIKINKNYKEISKNKSIKKVFNDVAVNIPSTWIEDKKNSWKNSTGSFSANIKIIKRESINSLLRNLPMRLKRINPNNELIYKIKRKINNKNMAILKFEDRKSRIEIAMYLAAINVRNKTYILLILGQRKLFELKDKHIQKIIKSFRQIK